MYFKTACLCTRMRYWIINPNWDLYICSLHDWLTFDLVLRQLLAGHQFLCDLELCGADPSGHPLQHCHAEYCGVYDAQTCQHARSSQGEVQIQQWNSVSHLMYLYMVPALYTYLWWWTDFCWHSLSVSIFVVICCFWLCRRDSNSGTSQSTAMSDEKARTTRQIP